MRKATRPAFVASLLALTFTAFGLVGCGDPSQPAVVQPTATAPAVTSGDANGGLVDARPTTEKSSAGSFVPPSGLEIIEVLEGSSPRDALGDGLGKVVWVLAGQSDSLENQVPRDRALEAIRSEGARLAAVKYVPLALEDYKEVTGKLVLTAEDFQGGDVRLEYIGQVNGEQRYLLFSFKGKDIPQRPDREQVFRWVQPYALYDNTTLNVVKLVATIHGEVHE